MLAVIALLGVLCVVCCAIVKFLGASPADAEEKAKPESGKPVGAKPASTKATVAKKAAQPPAAKRAARKKAAAPVKPRKQESLGSAIQLDSFEDEVSEQDLPREWVVALTTTPEGDDKPADDATLAKLRKEYIKLSVELQAITDTRTSKSSPFANIMDKSNDDAIELLRLVCRSSKFTSQAKTRLLHTLVESTRQELELLKPAPLAPAKKVVRANNENAQKKTAARKAKAATPPAQPPIPGLPADLR